jgi:Tol biopolymer transport system component
MGQVYRATDLNLKRTVALKVLPDSVAGDPDRLARFQREAEVLAALNHPNIAAIYGLEKSGQATALVMELVDGLTLEEVIGGAVDFAPSSSEARQAVGVGPHGKPRKVGGLPLDVALPIAKQIAEALEAAHDAGIVHRDLKPANIKVRPDDTVKVLDFGLAKARGQELQSSSGANPTMTSPAMTQMGMILGTAAYMAPEQAKGRPVDRRADVWAFGAVLYEMVTGTRAFAGDDVSEVLASVLAREPDWSKLPAEAVAINGVIRRCLERDPRQRFGDMQSVRLALSGALSVGPIAQGAASASGILPASAPTTRTRARSSALAWVVAAAAALAAAIVGIAYLNRPAPEAAPVVKSSILPPPKVVFDFDVTVGPAAISPNGKLIAFSGREPGGRIQLWVRPVDSLEARSVAGTDGASFPFWKPDSQAIGFYSAARGRLERVDLAGGPPVVIANAGYVRGASWAPDDTVLYDASDSRGQILEVSIANGTPKAVIKSGEGFARSPWVLPDGKHFLYVDRTARKIHLASRDGTTDKPLVDATSHAVYASGHLIFMRESTLLAQPFDLTTLEPRGTAQPIARDVQMLLGDARGVFSVSDTGTLLFLDGAATASMTLAWFDGKGTRVGTASEIGSARGVRLSPDGRMASVGVLDAEGHLNIWTIDLATDTRHQLTFAQQSNGFSFVTWSPDSRTLAYPIKRDSGYGIVRRPAGGGAEEALFALPPDQSRLSYPRVTAWTSDGATILYSGSTRGGIYRLPLLPDSSGVRAAHGLVKEPDTAQNARLGPGDRWFSYQGSFDADNIVAIFVEKYPGGGRRQQVAARGTIALWAPDGRSLYYADDNMLTAVSVTEVDGALTFGPPRAIMPIIVGRGYSYDVAKDGRILAIVSSETRAARPLTLVQNWVRSLAEK